MKNKIKISIIIIWIIFLLSISIIVINFTSVINKPLKVVNNEIVVINDGDSFYSVLEKLDKEDKIRNKLYIKLYVKAIGLNLEVLPGEYVLNNDMTVKEVVKTFTSERNNSTMLTIPEGFSVDDIAYRVEELGVCTAKEFIETIKKYPLPSYIKDDPNKKYNLEGFLFPDTYSITDDTTAEDIINAMIIRFEEVWQEVTRELNINVNNADIEKVITIASMIEKEARIDEERSLISSVIYNRIKNDMPLQFCSTVIYAHGYHIEELLYSHLEIESPFNTYKYSGLPEGAIASPGISSIIAALKPQNTDYLYYLLESENKHYFTNNYNDFLSRKEELGY